MSRDTAPGAHALTTTTGATGMIPYIYLCGPMTGLPFL